MVFASNQKNNLEKWTSHSMTNGLWQICLPLMLSALSGTLMVFFQRAILAKYNTYAMLGATSASNVFLVFQFGAVSIAMIAEVFVGQFNGASLLKRVSEPVWQMIWFALLCSFIMIPIGLWGNNWFIPAEFAEHGGPYFKWMMIFGPLFPLVAALSAFFVGRKKVKIVTLSIILGNVLNFFLVLLLVFGIPGILKPMGAKGAAIATGLAECCVALMLLLLFLSPHHRKKYNTHYWHFNLKLFINCIKIGFPNTIGHMSGTAAWAFIFYLLAGKGFEHITVMSIGFSIWMLFSFITEGLQKGVTTVAANCIGAQKSELLLLVLKNGLKLQFFLAMMLAVPLIIMPEVLIKFFIPVSNASIDLEQIKELLKTSCRWLWLAYLFDGMAWVIDGILTAAGDTRFIMLMNSIGTWVLCICPIYFFVVCSESGPILTLQIISGFCIILFMSYCARFFYNNSIKKNSDLLISGDIKSVL